WNPPEFSCHLRMVELSCQISILKAVMYILAQMLGSNTAIGIAYGEKLSNISALGDNSFNAITPCQAFGTELLATFQLVLCVVATTSKRRLDVMGLAPLTTGLSVCLGHLAAVDWVGLVCGGVAALIYDFLLTPPLLQSFSGATGTCLMMLSLSEEQLGLLMAFN
ncbi:hypothetical protein Z043_117868, partial [Scleropages formosus]